MKRSKLLLGRDLVEEVDVLYVAMTRAERVLYVSPKTSAWLAEARAGVEKK